METFSGKNYRELLSNRAVSVISLTQLVRTLGRSAAWIFIPVYLSLIRGIPYFEIGLLFFGTAMVSLPASIYGGNLIDRIGRRKVGILIPPLLLLTYTLMAYSAFTHSSLYLLIISFIAIEPLVTIQGIVDNVLITDIVEETKRNDAFSILRIAANLGFSVGPALGGFLAYFNYGYVFAVPAVISLLDFFLFYIYIKEPEHPAGVQGGMSFPSKDHKFIILCIILALIWFVTGQWGTTLTLFWSNFDHLTNRFIGILYGLNGIFVVTMQIPINWLFRHVNDHTRIAIGGAVYAFSFLSLAFFSSTLYLLLDVFFITMGENIISPVAYSMIGKLAPSDKRGQYFGAFQVIVGFTVPFAPLMGTFLLGRFSASILAFWGIISGIGIIISLMVFIFGRRINNET